MGIFLTIGLLFLQFFLWYKYLTWHFGIWKKLGLPGPKPRLIFGNFPSSITGKRPLVHDVDEVYSAYKKSHRAIGVFNIRNPEILLLDPKLAHELLVTNFSKFRDNFSNLYVLNKSYDKIAARNPFFSTGTAWKERRADLIGGLAVSRLKSALPIWRGTALKLRDYLKEKIQSKGEAVIDAKDLAARFTIDILGDFLWGIKAGIFETKKSKENQLLQMILKMLKQAETAEEIYSKLSLLPFLKLLFRKSRVFPLETDTFFSSLTKYAMELRSKDSANTERIDFLNYIMNLQACKHISHDDIVGHMLTVVLDGYETTAIVIYHTLFYLAKYPRIQKKLRSEIQAHLGEKENGFMTFETLNSLPYLEQCIYETIRMISPLPKISRICTEATDLIIDEATSIPIKPGMVLTIPAFSYHHDPEYFPNPYEYKPERFDNAAHTELTKSGVLLPFGDGPRICLGVRYGLLAVKTCVVEILKDYHLKCTPETVEEKKPDSRSFIFGLEGNFSLNFQCLESKKKI